jgi:hypothetical protein
MKEAFYGVGFFFLSMGGVSLIFWSLYFAFDHKERKVKKLEKLIQEEALKGNKFAFAFMVRDRGVTFSRIPLIEEALKGNEYALEILGIKIEEKK